MKHISRVSMERARPAKAESLLVKQQQVALIDDIVSVLAKISDFIKGIQGA